jgi:hypothetical protein
LRVGLLCEDCHRKKTMAQAGAATSCG